MFDFYASEPHYWDHLAPIYAELGRSEPVRRVFAPHEATATTVVASWVDAKAVRTPVIYVEHGAGQQYGNQEGYSGSHGLRGKARGFICPSEVVADRWRASYRVPAVAVGCPKLDRWLESTPEPMTVGVTFHWRCAVAREAGTAWDHFVGGLEDMIWHLTDLGYTVLGHAHPRMPEARHWFTERGLYVDHDELMARAGALVADNTSLLPEFMALDRPVAFLHSPKWRRSVDHGGRFWDWCVAGIEYEDPKSFLIEDPIAAAADFVEDRRKVADSIYAHRDGSSSRRAADFIKTLKD